MYLKVDIVNIHLPYSHNSIHCSDDDRQNIGSCPRCTAIELEIAEQLQAAITCVVRFI